MLPNRQVFKSLIRTYTISSRLYNTNTKPTNKVSLYAKISPLGNPNVNVTPELEKWVESGNKVRFAELQRIIVDLRKRKRFAQALQVSEWMKNKGTFEFTPVQHAVQLDLIGKVHGSLHAESYFNSLNDQNRTDKVYGALLHCYARQRQTEKALSHFNNMNENGFALSSVAFNDIMCLYSNTGQNDKIPEVFKQMKDNGVQPDNLSYRICINSFGLRSNFEGLENILNEMENDSNIVMDWNTYASVANIYIKAGLENKANIVLKKAEEHLDTKDGLGYNHLISLHARLGNKDDVLRLWVLEKDVCKRCINRDYINMLESLVKLGELDEAEKVLKEWEISGNCFDFRVPSVIIVGYIETGLCEKAEMLLNCSMKMGKALRSDIWGRLAAGYLEKGEVDNALRTLKVGVSENDASGDNKFGDKIVMKILMLVGEKGSVGDAEKVVNLLRCVAVLKRQMYHALLKSSVGAGKEVGGILDIMRADNFEKDKETLKILEIGAE
ncbi:pentatricopeptide repeat-containing protein at4g21705 mitochondrial [Phtheirospermum japonicum]|uniref:Pentatricopeptide repeat-containing protein at4g21705 mitochondrial n=1 Tax=Phtheirospermum japonicum TaxID=374723 RepID=A0A830CVG0_9LAMI|nr:pentatricopeptide repeat-containing protein at4g21705 mitochondrial [Phtheirospermum japonicum]